ncbi:MAG: hypothetical protein GX998_11270 [Firmicutes bacterium]|nr:hypothetical protein [Bacillota bacterium]
MRGRRIVIILSVLILGAVAFGSWQWWRWTYLHMALDPQAKIDPGRTYEIDVWVEMGDGLVPPPSLDDQFWSNVAVEFQSSYPNAQISFKAVAQAELEKEMQTAVTVGRPPHVLVTSSEWFRFWSDLQLPIDRFLPEAERGQYFPAALARVVVGQNHMAWPSQIQPRLWVINQRRLQQLHSDADLVLAAWEQVATWSGDDWYNLRDKLKQLRDLRLSPIAHQLGTSEPMLQVLVTAGQGLVGQDGELLISAELIRSLCSEWQAMEKEQFVSWIQGTLLTDFFSNRRAIIGPVGLWIWSLGDNARRRGYRALTVPDDVMLLPPPGSSGSGGYLSGTMVDVAVFRHRRFQGLAHARLSMELARDLSQKLGIEMSRTGLGVPANRRLLDEWQSIVGWSLEQRTSLQRVLEQPMGLPSLDRQWHEARRQMVDQLLEPALEDFIHGRIGLDVAEELETKLRLFLEPLQASRSKGKSRQSRNTE